MSAPDLAWLLELDELDRDLYRSKVEPAETPRHRLYGGLVFAWALMAGAKTVEADRPPHSIHGYFLRPGQADKPVIFKVDRDRDGRSFTARHITAVQDGEVILSALASFHVVEESGVYESEPRPPVVPPDELSPMPHIGIGQHAYLDVRNNFQGSDDGDDWRPPSRLWMKVRQPLADDPVLHACVLAYMSDLGTGFGELDVENLPKGGPTIDHTMWLQGAPRADEWVYLDQWPLKAGGARGLYLGAMHTEDGRLVASLTQEALLRPGMMPKRPPFLPPEA